MIALELRSGILEAPGGEDRRNMSADSAQAKPSPVEELLEILHLKAVRSVYQPILHLASGKVYGYEALTRGPQGSQLESPLELFQVAKDHGLLTQLEAICLESAVRNAKDLPPECRLFVNVIPSYLGHEHFEVSEVMTLLKSGEIPPERFVLELTESVPLPDDAILTPVLQEFREVGIQVALDDYGSGFANLESLVAIRPHILKIDRALIWGIAEDPLKQEILRAMKAITASYGGLVLAEGVEKIEELRILQEVGIEYGQGYFFARPGPAFPEARWPDAES